MNFIVFNFTFYFLGRSLLRVFKRDKNSDDEKKFSKQKYLYFIHCLESYLFQLLLFY